MRERLAAARERVAARDAPLWRDAGVAGFWLLRWTLGILLVIYALSFLGPAPVAPANLGYESPDETAATAVENLRAATYRVTVAGTRSGGPESGPFLRETRTVDNRAHQYAIRRRSGVAVETGSETPLQIYGTETAGYGRMQGTPGSATQGDGPWRGGGEYRYHPARNIFANVDALRDARATVVTDTPETYVVRVEDPDAVDRVVDLPGHTQGGDGPWNATLTLSIARETGRLTDAEYRYREPETGLSVQATYSFEYGGLIDVDRPLATYPPGAEVVARLDLGIGAADALLRGVGL